ncbi:cytochrome P450 [Antribacter gilvus]|uniref:cytochrome P450 n=1 Tax=Antribacter gilvus TaxID=2304675 RepID=UPI000F7B32F5|nr:cytochrome P450 [Antribacter gilvus]
MTTTETTRSATDLAPGPRGGLQAWRNLRRFQEDAPSYFLELQRTYGDMVRLPLGFFTVHLPFSPDAVRHVLQAANGNYRRGKGYDFFKIYMGTGLLTTDGEEWKARRMVVNPLFHRRAIEGMSDAMVSATSRVLDTWAARAAGGTTTLDVIPESMHITLDALGSAMFDRDLEPDHPRIGPAMDQAIEAMVFRGEPRQLMPAWMPFGYQRRVARTRADLYDIVGDIVRAHREGEHADRTDLVALLLAAQGSDDGPDLGDDDVRDELMTIFMAGHETSGTGIAWTLAELARHPEVQERAHQEIETVLAGRAPGLDDLAALPYLKQLVDESLRLHPPIWVFPRDAVADDVVGGHRVPAGESVFLTPFVTHRMPDLWPDPERFDPDRFAPGQEEKLPRFAYFPFGGGQRKCVGWMMALQQSYLTVAMVLQRFRLGTALGFDDGLATLVSLRPPAGLRLSVTPRNR